MNRRDAEKREQRRERREFDDELDVLKRRRYRPEKYVTGFFLTPTCLARMRSRFGGALYDQDYRQHSTTNGLIELYERRRRVFGTLPPAYEAIADRIGYVRKYRSIEEYWAAQVPWFPFLSVPGVTCEACGEHVPASCEMRAHLESGCLGAKWKRKQLLSELRPTSA